MNNKHLLILLFLTLLFANSAYAEVKTALVIGVHTEGNKHLPTDADGVATTLSGLGFDVLHENDVTLVRFNQLLAQFTEHLKAGGTGLFFYAGHGAQINNVNYLMPVNDAVRSIETVKNNWINLDVVTNVLTTAPLKARFIFLDACRANPFLVEFAKRNASGDTYIPGLAKPMAIAPNMLFSLATSPNEIAIESAGQDDFYTTALRKYIGQSGVGVEEVMRRVATYVEGASAEIQVPWYESSLTNQIYFRDPTYVLASLESIDDAFLMSMDGQEVMAGDGPMKATIPLHVGVNKMVVRVYNQHTFTGGIEGLGGHLPEGWNYTLRIRDQKGAEIMPVMHALEDRPTKDGPHHGHLFVVASFDIRVNDSTGVISVSNIDDRVWTH